MFSQKDFYKEITDLSFNDERRKKQEEFTSRERDLINNTNMVDDFGNDELLYFGQKVLTNTMVRLAIDVKSHEYIHIWKLEDEFFLVKNTALQFRKFRKQFYYKCDQIEGVMKLLKDLNIN